MRELRPWSLVFYHDNVLQQILWRGIGRPAAPTLDNALQRVLGVLGVIWLWVDPGLHFIHELLVVAQVSRLKAAREASICRA